ncbi:MAG TPA: alpha/beta hydrolase, partial [Roseiarcus sp.]|nr:alpha/beta hydrolase [Roseiarcus sp.]
TWASRGKPTAYVYDLNSATAARDSLEHTLRLLLSSNAEEVNVLAHSISPVLWFGGIETVSSA